MRRDEVIARLKEVEPEIRARGAQALYLFGSHARDEATADSDVDVFVDKDQSRPFGFDRFIDIYFQLCDRLDGKVDYGTRDGLSPAIRAEIERKPFGFLMKAHRVRLRLIEIREEISGIQSLTRDADLALFSSSWTMKRTVEHALLIIAEAAKHIPQPMKDSRP